MSDAKKPYESQNSMRDFAKGFMRAQDLDDIKSTANKALAFAQNAVEQGVQMANSSLERARQEQARISAERAVASRYKSARGFLTAGHVMRFFGIFYAVCAAIALVLLISMGVGPAELATMAVLLVGMLWLAHAGNTRVKMVRQFDAYRQILGTREQVTISELAERTGKSQQETMDAVRYLLDKRFFTEGCLDDQAELLMVTNAAYVRHVEARRAFEKERAVELLDEQVKVAAAKEAPKQATKRDGTKLNVSPELLALLKRGAAQLDTITALNQQIESTVVTERTDSIVHVVTKVFERAAETNEQPEDLKQLVDYYLPTTIKLLSAYERLEEQPVQGETILSAKKDIEDTLLTLKGAFDQLLDNMFEDLAWDVSTDISVLHTLLAQDGLVDDAFGASSKEHS